MPNPSDYENQDDFISACIATRQEEHPEEDNDQSAAVCFSMWKDKAVKTHAVIRKTHADTEHSGMEFVLSDATVDRYGDVIHVDGWELRDFKKNPIALFNHNSDFPIGRWKNLRVQDGALRGHLEMAPAGTSARIDELRKLVEAGILRAVSVGFRPIESKPRSKSAPGELYVKSDLVECSLVSVPANPNALSIAKGMNLSRDTIDLVFAKHGNKGTGGIVTRGANGEHAETLPSRRNPKMSGTPIAQRIQDAEQRIVGFKDQLTAHLAQVDDENPTEADTATIETLTKKIEEHEHARDALKKAELRIATQSSEQNNGAAAAAGNGGVIVRNARPFALPAKKVAPQDHLWRALTVAVKHHCEGRTRSVLDVMRDVYGENDTSEITRVVMANLVTRAAVVPADTTTTHWAPELVQTVIGDLIASLMPMSIYPRLAALGGSFTFGRNGVVSLPARDATPTIAGAFVAQGAAIPVKQGSFTAISLTPKKMGVITTLTREISEHSTPSIEAILRNAILEDTAVAIDTILTDATAADTTRPAGLRAGVTKVSATGAGGIAAIIGDLKGLAGALITNTSGNVRKPVWIMNPGDVLAASLIQGATGSGDMPFAAELARGTLLGYPVVQSTVGTTDMMYLIDAADFITATGDTPNFSVSDQAVLHMENTNPAAIGAVGTPNTVAAPVRSLWQTDTMAIRMIMDLNWAMQRTGTVQWTETMTWN